MSTPADDRMPWIDAPAVPVDARAGRHGVASGDAMRPRRPTEFEVPRHPSPPPQPRHPLHDQRYYVGSTEPGGEFVEVIVAVTDDGRRRYFTTRDGARLDEVDEDYFELQRETGAWSLLELDDREMGELEAELRFVQSVRGRDPLQEAEPAHSDELPGSPEATDAVRPVAWSDAAEPVAWADAAEPGASAQVTDIAPPTEVSEDTQPMDVVTAPMPTLTVAPAPAPAFEQAAAAASAPMTDTLVDAIDAIAQVALAQGIAFVAHRGQLDRSGGAYVDHPGRIAERFDPVTEPVPAAAAWLHDVLEDTDVSAQELLEAGVLPAIVEVVQLLTRTPDVTDAEYYARIRHHPEARRVKLADIDDNTAPWRTRRLDFETQVRLAEKYRYARERLRDE